MLASTPTISTAAAVTLTYPPWILARSVTRRVPPNNTVKRQPGTSQPIDAFGDMVREPDPRIHVPGVSAVVVFGGITHGSVVEDKLPIPPSSSQLVTIEPFERGRGGGSPARSSPEHNIVSSNESFDEFGQREVCLDGVCVGIFPSPTRADASRARQRQHQHQDRSMRHPVTLRTRRSGSEWRRPPPQIIVVVVSGCRRDCSTTGDHRNFEKADDGLKVQN